MHRVYLGVVCVEKRVKMAPLLIYCCSFYRYQLYGMRACSSHRLTDTDGFTQTASNNSPCQETLPKVKLSF